MTTNSIQVFIKVRPLITREQNENASSMWQLTGQTLKSTDKQYEMTFDHIYDENRTTQELFDDLAKPIVTSALKGINGTIFAYGQTSSGKTYTMMGDNGNPGIIPLTVREIFEQIENAEDREFLLRIGYIEIHNEKIYDLLDAKKPEITKIQEPNHGEVTVNQLEVVATSEDQILKNYEHGNGARRIGETNMNERSSRSHTIFKITIESREVGKTSDDNAVQVSSLNLVDLAGSERADQTKATGDRLKEGGHINKSLLALGNVIRVLSEASATAPAPFVNYRDSKLTRILSASLGGNAMTSIICTVTPAALDETFSTLVFAQNAKKIENKPKVNEVMSEQVLMRRMQREIQNLKNELDTEKSRNSELQIQNHLKQQISDRENQFLHSHNITSMRIAEVQRRRTWCPSSVALNAAAPSVSRQNYLPPVPIFFIEPHLRNSAPDGDLNQEDDVSEEVFVPGEIMNLDRTLSPGARNSNVLAGLISTPREMKVHKDYEESPNLLKMQTNDGMLARIKFLEDEIQELRDFKKIENIVGEDHKTLVAKLSKANDQIASLELKIEDLEMLVKANNCDVQLVQATIDRDKALQARSMSESVLASASYEHELFKERAKKRETELVQTLDEVRNESKEDALKARIRDLEVQLKQSVDQVLQFQSQKSQEADPLAGGDTKVNEIIVQLQMQLQKSIEDQEKAERSLKSKKEELARFTNEYDEVSNQLMDSIQENENLIKQLDQLKDNEPKIQVLVSKIVIIEGILSSIQNDEEPPAVDEYFTEDISIQTLLELRMGFNEVKNQESIIVDMEREIENLRVENECLKIKLPTIEESTIETENELKDQLDSLSYELCEARAVIEEEINKRKLVEDELGRLKDQMLTPEPDEQKVNELAMALATAARLSTELEILTKAADEKDAKFKELEDAMISQEAEMASEIAGLKDGLQRIMSLGEENVRLKTVEKEYKRMVNELTQKMDEREAEEFTAARGLVEVHSQRINELELNEANAKITFDQQSEMSKQSEIVSRLETENEMLIEKIELLEKEIHGDSDIKERNLVLDLKVHELEDEIANLQQQMTEKSKDVSSNTTNEFESIACDALLEENTQQLTDAGIKIAKLEDELKMAQEETQRTLAAEVEKIEKLEAELVQSKATNEESSRQLQQEIESNKQKISDAKATIAQLGMQLREKSPSQVEHSMSSELLAEINALKVETESLKSELESLKVKAARSESELANLRIERDELITEFSAAESLLNKLKGDWKDLQEFGSKSTSTIDGLKSQIVDLHNQMSTKDDSNKILESCLSDKNQEIEELMRNLQSFSKESKEIGNFKMQLAAMEAEQVTAQSTATHFEELKIEFNQLKVEKLSRENEYESLSKRAKELIIDNVKLSGRIKDLEQEFAKFDADQTNVKSKLVISEEEIKTLQNQLKERTDECDEIKTRYRRRSCDNDKKIQNLEVEKNKLIQEIGAVQAQKATVEQELQKLKIESQSYEQKLQKLQEQVTFWTNMSSDNDVKYTLLDEAHSQLVERIQNDEAGEQQISSLNATIETLRTELETLKIQMEERKKFEAQRSSPEARRGGNDLFASQNQQLILEGFKSTPTRAIEHFNERKTRRQSVHDERRRLSVWERFTNCETQTDAVSEICACSDLTQKVKDLQIEVRKRDCKISVMERMANHNPLKLDLEDLKKSLTREQREHNATRGNVESLERSIAKLEIKIEALSKNQIVAKQLIDVGTQAIDENLIDKSIFDQVEKKLNDMKRVCRQRQDLIDELQNANGKENVSTNINPKESRAIENENSLLKKKLQELEQAHSQQTQTDDVKASIRTDLENLQKKYDMTRRLCNLRNDDIATLKTEMKLLKDQYEHLQACFNQKSEEHNKLNIKYQKTKELCEFRLERINNLRTRYGIDSNSPEDY